MTIIIWKIMIKQILQVLLAFFIVICPGCKKCKEVGVLSFSSNNLSVIPYTGDEILVLKFFNGYWDSVKSTGKLDQYNDINQNSNSITDNQGCKGDYYSIEYNNINFTSISLGSALTISMDLEFDNPFITSKINRFLSISIGTDYGPRGFFYNKIAIENDSLIVVDSTVIFHKSLLIGNKEFTSVYEILNAYKGSDSFLNVYYSIQNGIVAFKNHAGGPGFVNKLE